MTHIHAVLAHKDFEMPNKYYFDFNKVICFSQQPIVTNLENVVYRTEGYDDRLVGEYAIWQYLLDNYKDVDWFSLHHYRRILDLYHEHFCVAKPVYFNCSLIQQTVSCHSVKLAQILEAILSKEDFEYSLIKYCSDRCKVDFNTAENVYIEDFANGGFSSGEVCCTWWRYTGFPLLLSRTSF